jgi:hypothetical protein
MTPVTLSNYSEPNYGNIFLSLPDSPAVIHTVATEALENANSPLISSKREMSSSSEPEPAPKKRKATSEKVEAVGPTALQAVSGSPMPLETTFFVTMALNTAPYEFFLNFNDPSLDCPEFLSHGLEDLDVCGCEKLPASLRIFLEKQAIEALNSTLSKDSLLTIVSIGPGQCYQELVYLAKCAYAGYNQIQLVLIDKEPVPIEALTQACHTYLSQYDINIVYYQSLESFQVAVAAQNHLKPNLVLMLDITEEEYEIDGTQLPEYCFQFFNQNNLFNENTVIARSDALTDKDDHLFAIASCAVHDGTAQTLPEIASKREVMIPVNEDFPSILQ